MTSVTAAYSHLAERPRLGLRVLTSPGGTFCWSANARGQLGDWTTTNRLTPTSIAGQIFKP